MTNLHFSSIISQALKWIPLVSLLCISSHLYAQGTSIYLIRHTEKDLTQAEDPQLTHKGLARAQQWADLLKYESVNAVYSTDTRRTRDTATPIAESQGLKVKLYEVGAFKRNDLLDQHADQTIVIVGHSNTIPRLANKLLDTDQYSDLSEEDYDSLFVIDLNTNSVTSKHLFIPLANFE